MPAQRKRLLSSSCCHCPLRVSASSDGLQLQSQACADQPQGRGGCPYPSELQFPVRCPTLLICLGMRVAPGYGPLSAKARQPQACEGSRHPSFLICNMGACLPPRALVQNRSRHMGKAGKPWDRNSRSGSMNIKEF